MAFQLKHVSFGESEIEEFMLPKKKKDRNACVTGEHDAFWQRHECLERREHKRLSKRTHALLALGRASELRAAVEEYMMEPVLQVQQQKEEQEEQQCVAKSRRPPPPARRRSRSVGHSKVRQVAPLQGQRALDDQEATSAQMSAWGCASGAAAPSANDAGDCDPGSESEEEDETHAEQAKPEGGRVSTFRENFLWRRLPNSALAGTSQELEQDLPLSPAPPRTDDVLARPPPRSYQRPLRAYLAVAAAGHD
eukprot:TRINITY_DN3221_c0_g1_i3.p1 TRINITY_DN3221_c0_g1~~TRINITY_DN3221_c0_g1_i3.p1  ORF type:complete len:251 (-),score=60.47 TRINITY_DN3221_c0_g1_i3:56-808(-)